MRGVHGGELWQRTHGSGSLDRFLRIRQVSLWLSRTSHSTDNLLHEEDDQMSTLEISRLLGNYGDRISSEHSRESHEDIG